MMFTGMQHTLRKSGMIALLSISALSLAVTAFAQDATVEPVSPLTPSEDMQAVLDQLKAFEAPPFYEVVPRIARELPSPADAVVAVLAERGEPATPEPVADIAHRLVPGAEEDILVRIYTPEGTGPFPVIVYIHGGGWVIANLNTYDSSARALTNAAGAVVVSIAYRQSPEVPFPSPIEDVYAATQWIMQNAAEMNGDPARVAIVGESAGGNMATVTTLMARDRGGLMPIYQVLVYPVTQLTDFDTPSYQENAEAAPLSRAGMMWFASLYTPNEADRTNPYVSPLLAEDLSGLPPATIITASIDPLRSDGEMYANRLTEAGVAVVYQNYENVTHEFFGMGAVVDEAKAAVALAAEGLRGAFGN